MSLNMPAGVSVNKAVVGSPVYTAFFVFWIAASLYGTTRLILKHFQRKPNSGGVRLPLSIDDAEKGDVFKQQRLPEEEVFELEKRAFFSKVGICGVFSAVRVQTGFGEFGGVS